MNRVREGLSDPGFAVPDSIETAEICRKSGKRAVSGVCNHDPGGECSVYRVFCKGNRSPRKSRDKHVEVTRMRESVRPSLPY